jgi:hypothetical protein
LGVFSRLTGQNRSPRPPAMMMTKRSDEAPRVLEAAAETFREAAEEAATGTALTALDGYWGALA